MSLKVSKTFLNEVHNAAMQLSIEKPVVRLEKPFSGFHVSLNDPGLFSSELISYKEAGIEKEGNFFLICDEMMG